MEIYNDVYCVYIHTNKINGKKYVGQTKQKPEVRWNNGEGYKTCRVFYNAIKKYGWHNFEHEIVASNLTVEEANNFEILLIDKLNTFDRNYGYNVSAGGYNRIFSDEYRKKISERVSGSGNPRYGKHCSDETKRKISEANKGENSVWYGKHHSDETKNKLSDANTGKVRNLQHRQNVIDAHADFSGPKNPNAKKIRQYDLNKKLIKIWDCLKNASDELDISRKKIRDCCLGKIESINGFMFEYDNNINVTMRKADHKIHVVQCSLDNAIIQIYESARNADRSTGINYTGISACCRGIQKTAGGYRWRFATEEEVAEYENSQS